MNQVDVVIFGGGIAGLWTLARLTKKGFNAILLETEGLGAGQSIKSQGIIHGGLKYALSGEISSSVSALQDMPTLWQNCLQGSGEVDLRGSQVLATCQHMWSIDKLTGGITTLFASNAMKSNVEVCAKESWPDIIKNSAIQTKLYALSELVLDIPSVLRALTAPLLDRCIKLKNHDSVKLKMQSDLQIDHITIQTDAEPLQIKAKKYIFTAGRGNAQIMQGLSSAPAMQTRPLHMVLVKDKNLPALYGHCVSLNTVPRITITTHRAHDNTPIWYLGGRLAEDGVARGSAQQIDCTKIELQALFPKLDLANAQFATFFIDRAEAKQADGSKPAGVTMFAQHNYIAAWPTKLALAPCLADDIMRQLQNDGIQPENNQTDFWLSLPKPTIATPVWDQLL